MVDDTPNPVRLLVVSFDTVFPDNARAHAEAFRSAVTFLSQSTGLPPHLFARDMRPSAGGRAQPPEDISALPLEGELTKRLSRDARKAVAMSAVQVYRDARLASECARPGVVETLGRLIRPDGNRPPMAVVGVSVLPPAALQAQADRLRLPAGCLDELIGVRHVEVESSFGATHSGIPVSCIATQTPGLGTDILIRLCASRQIPPAQTAFLSGPEGIGLPAAATLGMHTIQLRDSMTQEDGRRSQWLRDALDGRGGAPAAKFVISRLEQLTDLPCFTPRSRPQAPRPLPRRPDNGR